MNKGFYLILKFNEIAYCKLFIAASKSFFLFFIIALRIAPSSFLPSNCKTFVIAKLASKSFPTASFPLANSRYAGKKPGICLLMLYSNLIPFPIGPAGLEFSLP